MTQRTRNRIEEGRKWLSPALLSALLIWVLNIANDTRNDVSTMLVEHKQVMATIQRHESAISKQGEEIAALKERSKWRGGYGAEPMAMTIK